MNHQRGQAVVLVALMMVALLATVGLAVDGGTLYLTHRRMQSTADLAAMAGAQSLPTGGTSGAIGAAAAIAAINGEQAPTSTVVANTPPQSGSFQGDALCVEVLISRSSPTYFMRVLGFNAVQIAARAVAQMGRDSPPYAVIALSPNANPGIDLAGGGTVVTTGAGIMANSNVASAIKHTSGGYVSIDGPVNAVGGINVSGVIADSIQPGMPYYPDPFANLLPPAYPSAGIPVRWGDPDDKNPSKIIVNDSWNVPFEARKDPSDPYTFAPGVYYGGIKMTGGTYYFAPGVYVIAGGGLEITGGNVFGNGVFFYNTVNGKGTKGGPVSITTTGSIELSPPSTALYGGMLPNLLFFQDRALSASNQGFNVEATSNTRINGTIYVPTNQVKITGGGDVGVVDGQVIADTVVFGGGAGIAVHYDKANTAHKSGSTLVE